MKHVYFVYITVPEKVFKIYLQHLVADKNVFRYYADSKSYQGLYAWASKQKLVDAFLEYRDPSIYKVIKKDVDDDVLSALMGKMEHAKIHEKNLLLDAVEFAKYSNKLGPSLKALSADMWALDALDEIRDNLTDVYASLKPCFKKLAITDFEMENISAFASENFTEFGLPAYAPYRIFTNEMIELLDICGYTLIHDIYWTNNQTDTDNASYQQSFGCTPFGKPMRVYLYQEVSLLVLYYTYPILGVTAI